MSEKPQKTEVEQLLEQLKEKDEVIITLQEELSKPVVCRRCGRSSAAAKVGVSEEILKKYYRTILAQEPFTHTIPLMKGLVEVTFIGQRGYEGKPLIPQTDSSNISTVENVMLVTSLSEIAYCDNKGGTRRVVYTCEQEELKQNASSLEKVDEVMSRIFANTDRSLIAQIRQASMYFVAVQAQLAIAGQDEDFYKGVGLS